MIAPVTQLLPHFRLFSPLPMLLMKVFLSRSHPAPDMPLGFVGVQNFSCLAGKGWIDLEKPLGNIWWCQVRNKKFRI